MSDAELSTLPHTMQMPFNISCRRLSLVTTTDPQKGPDGSLDAAQAAVDGKLLGSPSNDGTMTILEQQQQLINQHRRASLNVNVEYAVAMVNENPSLDDDDRFMSPFGTRRDSVCGQVPNDNTNGGRRRRRNLKQKIANEEEKDAETSS
jgi:hypothetical protein